MQIEGKNESHFVDHLVPLCFFLNVPLYLKSRSDVEYFQPLYPGVQFKSLCSLKEGPTSLFNCADAFIYAHFHRTQIEKLFSDLNIDGKNKRLIYLPHGNSEKGIKSFWMEQYALEDITLLYGKRMEAFLKKKHVFDLLRSPIRIGNLRRKYYAIHKAYYSSFLEKRLPVKKRKTLLYAPTWNDWEGDSSLDEIFSILKGETKEWDIWIKLHPRVHADKKAFIFKIEGALKKGFHLIEDIPLIYPLLDRVDAYLGDVSSVSYDFLSMDSPLYFLERSSPLYIHQTGRMIPKGSFQSAFTIIDKYFESDKSSFRSSREKVYNETFDDIDPMQIGERLKSLIKSTQKTPLSQLCIEVRDRLKEQVL